jgi:hypothetical protein
MVGAVVAAPLTDRLTNVPVRRMMTRRWDLAVRRVRGSEVSWMVLLLVLAVAIGVCLVRWPTEVPPSGMLIPLVIGDIVLGPRTLPWFVVLTLGTLVVGVAATGNHMDVRRVVGIVIVFVVGLIILVSSFRRTRLGVAGARGESMLVDLRDRINKQGLLPSLPRDWYAETVMRSAGGSSFAGDFMVASVTQEKDQLQVAVVDVSGKGEQAGTRSLLLSGAFGGLLGALPADEFLPAANNYLILQDWTEGFASAVHLTLDLVTGDFEIRSAGHPPAVQLHAGSGRWAVHHAEGPILGLMSGASFARRTGTLRRGDALLLYTDGLVETPHRDITQGIDRLLGQGERMLSQGFEQGAARLIDRVGSINDDRLLLLLHRR